MKPWLLVLLVACGDTPSEPGRITVTVREGAVPTVGAYVHVHGPDAALITTVVTDASGVATAEGVVPNSAVTVRGDADLRTILDVYPGDELLFATQPEVAGTPVPIQVPASTQPTLHRYLIWTSCGLAELVGATSGTLDVRGCTTADVLVEVQDDRYTSLEFAYAPDQAVSGALDLSALAYTPTALQVFSITNTPASWRDVHQYRTVATAKGPLLECDGFGGELRCPAVAGASLVDRVTAYDETVWHEAYFPATIATTSIDFAGLPIATIPDKPTFTLATNTVQWTGGAGANAVMVSLFEGDSRWTLYGPAPSDGRLVLPPLVGGFAPFTADAQVRTMLLHVVGSYAGVRHRVFATDAQGLVALTGERVMTATYEGGF